LTAKLPYFVHETAVVDLPVEIGEGSRVWHFCHIASGAKLGRGVSLGQNVFVAAGVRIGNGVKVQNNVSLFQGVELEDDVFCGPSCVFTNVAYPRAEISRKGEYLRTLVRRGATIGANATIVCGSTVGRYAFVGAGAVVTRQVVPDYALVLGVPARQAGWVGRHGAVLEEEDAEATLVCPESGFRYRRDEAGMLRCLDLAEDQPLPKEP
jgi:UDP-2-acetamido-3-amino-2,3-dideoxy-glucuronate N-acetyltransferase